MNYTNDPNDHIHSHRVCGINISFHKNLKQVEIRIVQKREELSVN